jgi:hypothetical protein
LLRRGARVTLAATGNRHEDFPMAARPHRWRRILLWPALTLLLVCLAASGYAWHLWQRLQQEQGIVALDWQGLALSRHGLRLEGLQLEQQAADGRRLRLAADAVRLDWQLLSPPRHLERLHIVQLQLDWQAADAPTGQSSRLPSRDELAASCSCSASTPGCPAPRRPAGCAAASPCSSPVPHCCRPA